MDPEELARAIRDLARWAERHAPSPEPALRRRLREHLGQDPSELQVVGEDLSSYDHVNVQVALDAYLAETGAEHELVGMTLDHGFRAGLAEISQGELYGDLSAPVEYVRVDVGDRVVTCLKGGLVLLRDGPDALVALIAPSEDGHRAGMRLEAMAATRELADGWLQRIRGLMREHNAYRGKVVAFGGRDPFMPAPLTVRRLPEVRPERIVLPEGTLERVERHTAGLARHRDALRAQGRHIKRGLLLHGPPGTGKTLTVMYLAGLMPERTVVLLTGSALGAVTAAVDLARSLEPAMVVLEDVDLVAMARSAYPATPVLFELLNAMDGLDEDADLLFVLTTNRPDALEPALASRPGRVDLAVELPLPDARARRALLELYGDGLTLDVDDWEPVVAGTDGVSPAFIRELMRRAALVATEQAGGGRATVGAAHLLVAVEELRHAGGRLTATLLGAEQLPADAAPPAVAEDDWDE